MTASTACLWHPRCGFPKPHISQLRNNFISIKLTDILKKTFRSSLFKQKEDLWNNAAARNDKMDMHLKWDYRGKENDFIPRQFLRLRIVLTLGVSLKRKTGVVLGRHKRGQILSTYPDIFAWPYKQHAVVMVPALRAILQSRPLSLSYRCYQIESAHINSNIPVVRSTYPVTCARVFYSESCQ